MRPHLNKASEAETSFRRVLRRHQLKWTAERREILRAIARAPGHFTADELAQRLQAAGLSASRATVYRALPLLVEAGVVQPMVLGGEVRRYESALGRPHHDHLVCTSCGKVIEFQYDAFEILQKEVAARHGFLLQGHVHELFGTCEACARSQPDLPESGAHG